MKKILMIVAICVALGCFVSTQAVFAQSASMTNEQFAELVVQVIGIELPAGSNLLPDQEYYEVMSNILAFNGIDYFINANPKSTVNGKNFTTVLYTMVGGEGALSESEKLEYLVASCQMPRIGSREVITLAQATNIMNNPACSLLIAEAYREPGDVAGVAGGGTGNPSNTDAPGFKLEETPGTFTPTTTSGV